MQVINKNSYITTIYEAIVVNNDTNSDPDGAGRVQLYIPSINYNYADDYQTYMNMSTADKKNESNKRLFSAFPWAVSLIKDLNNGTCVYGSYVEGDSTKFIILGINYSVNSFNTGIGGTGDLTNITNLALDVILHNEIGVEIGAWTGDGISDKRYETITLHDGGVYDKTTKTWIKQGCWAIGLIQWNGVRAYDTLYSIVSVINDWKSYFTIDCDLKNSLNASINAKSTIMQRDKYSLDNGWNPEKGSALYNTIKNIISSDVGKKVQREIAYNDTFDIINMLTDKGCTNPAILIYMADFYNQYGSGYSETTQKCVEACTREGNMIQQLDWLIVNQIEPNFKSFSEHISRRNTTYSYIKDLFNTGKLSSKSDLTYTNEGEYLIKDFVKRTTAPTREDYWYREDIGNRAYSMWSNGGNCAFYAWGRASEILGKKYDGATGNGVDYGNPDGKYEIGSTPKQGAIITWAKRGGGAGHVAIVEDVSQDGQTIWTSESGWKSFMFKYKERKNDGNWGAGSSYIFQNFKYLI